MKAVTKVRFAITAVFMATAMLFWLGCSEDSRMVAPERATDRVFGSVEQYQSRQDEIQLVDLETLAKMTESILNFEPQISENQLRDRLFFNLKNIKEGVVENENEVAEAPYIPGYGYSLTWAEFWLLMGSPWNITPTNKTVNDSLAEAGRQWPGMGSADTKQDAFRHSYWNILMAKRINLTWANDFSTAHESETTDFDATRMDLYNNSIGRSEYSRNVSQSESWFSNRLKSFSYIYYPRGFTGPYEYALVYIKK